MYISPVNNRNDWYVARFTYRGRSITEFANTRLKAIAQALLSITAIDKDKSLRAGHYCPEHGYIPADGIDPCDIPF